MLRFKAPAGAFGPIIGTSARKRVAFFAVILLGLGLRSTEQFQTAPKTQPDLRNITGLRSLHYAVNLASGRRVGSMQVHSISRERLRATLDVRVLPLQGFAGEVTIEIRSWRSGNVRIRCRGRRSDGIAEDFRETVRADPFLLRNGILAFRFRGGKRFFQLTRASDGTPKATTDWGTAALTKVVAAN